MSNKMNQIYHLNREVVVWGNDNYNLLGVLRQLVPFGIDTFVVFNNSVKHCASVSKYCKHYVVKNTSEAVDFLLSNYKDYSVKPILILTSDEMASIVDKNKDDFDSYFICSGTSKAGLLSEVLNKNTMANIAQKCGFLVPKHMLLTKETDISSVKYPCFIKPTTSIKGVQNQSGICQRCNDRDTVQTCMEMFANGDQYVLQEFVDKEYEVLVIGVRLWNGEVYIPGVFSKNRWRNGNCGSGSYGILTSEIPQNIDIEPIEKMLSWIDYHGQFSVEYGVVGDKAYFYEVNLRNDGTSDYFRQAGANTNLVWVLNSCGRDVTNIAKPVQCNAMMIDEIEDYNNVKRGIVAKAIWKQQKREASIYVYYDKYDIFPFFMMKWKQWNISRLPKRVMRKIYKLLGI